MTNMHKDHIRDDGTIDDLTIETYYAPLSAIGTAEDYLRVIVDNGGTDIETRIPFKALIQLGWTAPAK